MPAASTSIRSATASGRAVRTSWPAAGTWSPGVKRIGRREHAHPRDPEDSTVDEALDHGKDVDERSSPAVEEEQQAKPHRLRKRRITTPTDSAGESGDESAQEARPDTTARRKGTAKRTSLLTRWGPGTH